MIKKISFLMNGKKRVFVSPNQAGYFKYPGEPTPMTSNEFVNHPGVIDNDPTITLDDGNKYRVFHASNPNIPLVYPSVILDKHDEQLRSKREKAEKLKKKIRESSNGDKVYGESLIPPYVLGKNAKLSPSGNLTFPFSSTTRDDDIDSDEENDEFIYFDDDDDGLGGW